MTISEVSRSRSRRTSASGRGRTGIRAGGPWRLATTPFQCSRLHVAIWRAPRRNVPETRRGAVCCIEHAPFGSRLFGSHHVLNRVESAARGPAEMATPESSAPGDIVVRAVHSDSGPRYELTRRVDSEVMWAYVAFIGSTETALRFACNAARRHRVFFYPTAGSDEYQMHGCERPDE